MYYIKPNFFAQGKILPKLPVTLSHYVQNQPFIFEISKKSSPTPKNAFRDI